MNDASKNSLSAFPPVHAVLEDPRVRSLVDIHGRAIALGWIRNELENLRSQCLSGDIVNDRVALLDRIVERVTSRAATSDGSRIRRVINATGVILHTGLGRAPLSAAAAAAMTEISAGGNVEVDLETGERRHRGHQLQAMWQALTGCEDSLVVNNNAGATLLTLQALCAGREVVISRGQLIEIGGSFRLPDIFELSGARLREVGTTNRTHLADYERAIGPETVAVMHVHSSNYRIVGFTQSPGIAELSRVAHAHGLIAIDDIGSGSLVDVSGFGLPAEPTFPASLSAGADLVLGSGDKLLGGPQAGIILGREKYVGRIRSHPLARAVRVGKLTLAALSATLEIYIRGQAMSEIPVLAMLSTPVERLLERARGIREELGPTPLRVEVATDTAPVGGGTLPAAELPTAVLRITHASLGPQELARRLRLGTIRVFPRVQAQAVIVDLRSVAPDDDPQIATALRLLAADRSERGLPADSGG